MEFLKLREPGYALLAGEGIEIGGFEHPAALPNARRIIRCDRLWKSEVAAVFSEIDATNLPEVDVRIDVDREGLAPFADASLDFVVCCHVLEHLKNPIKAVGEILRVLRHGGRAALAVPDRDHTFDRHRPLTGWATLELIHAAGTSEPSVEDYMDIVRHVHPQMLAVGEDERRGYLEHLRRRREHLNVWDSRTFPDFLDRCRSRLDLKWRMLYEVTAATNRFEYFVVLEKHDD
ncbi:MAG TPA: methyltransferase domain-containing protein [Lacunisphaera sp.]|nr:methyltransferase domain-containing protein [Lacunisphaera sp.]